MTVRNFNEMMKVTKLACKTKKEPPVLSTEDQEIKQIREDRRKESRKMERREREK